MCYCNRWVKVLTVKVDSPFSGKASLGFAPCLHSVLGRFFAVPCLGLLTFLYPLLNFVFCIVGWNLGENSALCSESLGTFLLRHPESPAWMRLGNSPASDWVRCQRRELPNGGSWSLLTSFSLSTFFQKINKIEKFPTGLKIISPESEIWEHTC